MIGDTNSATKHTAHVRGIVEVICTMRGTDAQARVRVANVCKEAVLNFQTASSGSVRLDGGITGELEVYNTEGYVMVKGPFVQVLDREQRPVSSQMAQDISTIVALRDSNGLLVIIGKCQLRNKRVAVVLDMFSDQRADLVIDDYQKFKDRRQEEEKARQQAVDMSNFPKEGYQGDISKIENKTENEHFAGNVKQYRAFIIEGFPIEKDSEQLKCAVPEDKLAFIHDIQRIYNNETPSTSVCLIWKSFDHSPPGEVILYHDKGDSVTLTLKEVKQPACFSCLVLGHMSCLCDEKQVSSSAESDKGKETCAEALPQGNNIPFDKSLTQGKHSCANSELEAQPAINELTEKPQVAEQEANDARDRNQRNVDYEEYERVVLENEEMKKQLDTYEKRIQELESLVYELQEEIAPLPSAKSVDENSRRLTATDADHKDEETGRCTIS